MFFSWDVLALFLQIQYHDQKGVQQDQEMTMVLKDKKPKKLQNYETMLLDLAPRH
jgi:hypothetical protein